MKRLAIITGSSRGIGAAVSCEFSKCFPIGSHIILIARDLEKLNEVKKSIVDQQPHNQVSVIVHDFSIEATPAQYKSKFEQIISEDELKTFQEIYTFYNHANIEFGGVTAYPHDQIRKAYELNHFSVWSLICALDIWVRYSIMCKFDKSRIKYYLISSNFCYFQGANQCHSETIPHQLCFKFCNQGRSGMVSLLHL